jgi:hypothetical protein
VQVTIQFTFFLQASENYRRLSYVDEKLDFPLLGAPGNKALRKMFGTRREETLNGWRKSLNDGLRDGRDM